METTIIIGFLRAVQYAAAQAVSQLKSAQRKRAEEAQASLFNDIRKEAERPVREPEPAEDPEPEEQQDTPVIPDEPAPEREIRHRRNLGTKKILREEGLISTERVSYALCGDNKLNRTIIKFCKDSGVQFFSRGASTRRYIKRAQVDFIRQNIWN